MIPCPVKNLWELRSQTVNELGKDRTGKIQYQFNSQGWRCNYDYDFAPDHAFFGSSLVLGIGVQQHKTFAGLFDRSHNYGLATKYTNQHIVDTILNFVNSELYLPSVKMAVVWSERDPEIINNSWHLIEKFDIKHFFCGQPRVGRNCWAMIKSIDYDASGTHMGPETHRTFYKILCSLFKQ